MRRHALAFAVVLAATSVARVPHADDAGDRRAAVVARVGKRAVTVGELEDKLARVAPFQLQAYGKTPEEAKKKFLETVIIPELLFVQAAEDKKLDAELPTEDLVKRARSTATLRAIRAAQPPAASLTDDDVAKYYEANKALYDTPERIQIWRVLFKTREEADAALAQTKRDPSVKAFTELARDKSLDKATAMRAGNLGFVGPDGVSNEAGVKVDPAVLAAARTVKDGELVPQPVAEGDAFGVVWRRGTVPANKRPIAEVSAQIRETLHRERMEKATRARIDELRKSIKDYDDKPLRQLEVKLDDGPVGQRRRALPDAGR
ncbi:MAG: peptidyl-prolyl cis-trans isomerase [Myxococcales bacterium]|jgi:peptidyl-prolyl cis-trans isomerase C|nr:peptidyl-prolyl cis-trans isomerase [Myxococcales bacterium]